jgi:ABC-type uncharacterized transport system auxiliary subunit
MKIIQIVIVTLFSPVLLMGCLTPATVTPTQRFMLAPEPVVAEAEPSSLTLGMRPIIPARPYRIPMAYQEEDQRLSFRRNHDWAEEPFLMVTRAILDAVRDTGRFADSGDAADMPRPDLVMTGELRRFHEDRTVAPHLAVIEVRLELRHARNPMALWAETLRETEPLSEDSAAAFAAAMSRALSRLAETTAGRLSAVSLTDTLNQ